MDAPRAESPILDGADVGPPRPLAPGEMTVLQQFKTYLQAARIIIQDMGDDHLDTLKDDDAYLDCIDALAQPLLDASESFSSLRSRAGVLKEGLETLSDAMTRLSTLGISGIVASNPPPIVPPSSRPTTRNSDVPANDVLSVAERRILDIPYFTEESAPPPNYYHHTMLDRGPGSGRSFGSSFHSVHSVTGPSFHLMNPNLPTILRHNPASTVTIHFVNERPSDRQAFSTIVQDLNDAHLLRYNYGGTLPVVDAMWNRDNDIVLATATEDAAKVIVGHTLPPVIRQRSPALVWVRQGGKPIFIFHIKNIPIKSLGSNSQPSLRDQWPVVHTALKKTYGRSDSIKFGRGEGNVHSSSASWTSWLEFEFPSETTDSRARLLVGERPALIIHNKPCRTRVICLKDNFNA